MKSCPSCQQVYQDDGPDFCTNDGTPLVRSTSEYNPGASPGGQWQQPPQGWQPPPPTGYGYQPADQYPPTGQYPPPYGYAPPSGGGAGISKAALFTGIGAAATIVLAIIIGVLAYSNRSRDMLGVSGIFSILALLAGLAAIVLGIVAISMANKNPSMNKTKGVVGLCLGIIPILIWLISLASYRGRFR
jgi:hypothetical protein